MSYHAQSLAEKKVVVIGGTSGIGFAVAELARAQGASVVIASSSDANVKAAAARLGAEGARVDLRDEASVASFFAGLGRFDHLAITAGDWGGGWYSATRDIDLAQARDQLEVRFWGVLAAVKHGVRTIAEDGSITLTGGLLSHRPMKGAPLLTALGGACEFLARGLAVDLAPVRVNAVSPGLVLTEHVKSAMPAEHITAAVSRQPIARGATPAEAAQAYLYAMLNDYLTGHVLPLDGGALLV